MMLHKNTKVKVRSPDEETDYFDIVAGIYYLPRLYVLNVYIFNEKELLQANKGKKQKIPCANYYGRGLRQSQRFWQIYLPKPNPCYIVWNKQQVE